MRSQGRKTLQAMPRKAPCLPRPASFALACCWPRASSADFRPPQAQFQAGGAGPAAGREAQAAVFDDGDGRGGAYAQGGADAAVGVVDDRELPAVFAQVSGDVRIVAGFQGDADDAVAVAGEAVDGGRGVAAVDAPVTPDVEQGRAGVVEADGFAVAGGKRGQVGDGGAVRRAVPVKREDNGEDDEQVEDDAAQGAPQAARRFIVSPGAVRGYRGGLPCVAGFFRHGAGGRRSSGRGR